MYEVFGLFVGGVGTIIEIHTTLFDRKPTADDLHGYTFFQKALRNKWK